MAHTTLVRLARLVAAAELPIFLAIAPLLLFPSPARMFALIAVPIVWSCARISGGRFVPRTPLNVALWCLLVMVGVSLYATTDIRFSLGKVSGVVLGVLIFWAMTRWMKTTDRVDLGVAVFVLAGAGLAVVGLLGTAASFKYPPLRAAAARLPFVIRGVPGAEEGFSPNAVAGCLVLFVPLQVALVALGTRLRVGRPAARDGISKWVVALQAILLLLTTCTVLLLQSRGAWTGLVFAAVAALFWSCRRTRLVTLGTAAVVVVAAVVSPATWTWLSIGLGDTGLADTVAGRVELWSRGLYGVQDFPFTGLGMNGFRKAMPALYPTFFVASQIDVAHAHNHLLQAALDLGLPGLVAYSALWLLTGALLVCVYTGSGDRVFRTIAGGLGAGLVAHFVFGLTDAIPLGAKVGVLYWFALALSVGLHQVALERPSP